jgi:hypothetical protein
MIVEYSVAHTLLLERQTRLDTQEARLRKQFALYGEYAVLPQEPGLAERLAGLLGGLKNRVAQPAPGAPEPAAA